jgi:hypothetical protein
MDIPPDSLGSGSTGILPLLFFLTRCEGVLDDLARGTKSENRTRAGAGASQSVVARLHRMDIMYRTISTPVTYIYKSFSLPALVDPSPIPFNSKAAPDPVSLRLPFSSTDI